MKNESIKRITGVAVLLAIEIVLQAMGNYITPGVVNINLSLIPIAIGAILYGPYAGALLGFGSGLVVLLSPSTQAFTAISVFGTIITCLLKCTIAGFVAGSVFKLFKKRISFGIVLSSLLIPVINTGLFILAVFTIFGGSYSFKYVLTFMIGWNFLIEAGITALLSPAIIKIIKIYKKEKE